MRIIGLVSWFDEQCSWLAELVASMARARVDHVVAVDGAFGLYPEARGASPSEQTQTVLATALGAGMGVTVHVPADPWFGNEVEKRSFLFAAGHLVAEPGVDWLWVCDADEVIETAFGLRARLEASERDVAEVSLVGGGGQYPIRKLFRAYPDGIRVEGYHARYVDGDGRVLWDYTDPQAEVDAENCWDVRVRHRLEGRVAHRVEARADYYALRDELGVEHVRT